MKKNDLKKTLLENQIELTQFVIDNLSSGMPWSKCFGFGGGGEFPKSISSGKRYSGGNVFWLAMVQARENYSTNEWGTYKAWKKAGANVQKGQKSTRIIFYKPCFKEDKSTNEKKTFWVLKSYSVFNRDQTDLEKEKEVDCPELFTVDGNLFDYLDSEEIKIQDTNGRAFYRPSDDSVGLPKEYTAEDAGYAVVAHEIIHSTGHKSRLGRDGIVDLNFFGSHSYSYEELIAELGSMFLCSDLGYESDFTKQNGAAYLSSWIKRLESNPQWLWKAAGEASRACAFVLDRLTENNTK